MTGLGTYDVGRLFFYVVNNIQKKKKRSISPQETLLSRPKQMVLSGNEIKVRTSSTPPPPFLSVHGSVSPRPDDIVLSHIV